LTGRWPALWSGFDAQLEIGVGSVGIITPDVSNLASITAEIRPCAANGQAPDPNALGAVMSGTVNGVFTNISQADWLAGTLAHGIIPFTAAQTALPPGNYWITIYAITTDNPTRRIAYSPGPFRILQSGAGMTASIAALGAGNNPWHLDITALSAGANSLNQSVTANLALGTTWFLIIAGDFRVVQLLTYNGANPAAAGIYCGADYDAVNNPKAWFIAL